MISVTTPLPASHALYAREAYQSLCGQTVRDWEWIVIENAGGKLPEDIKADPRVHAHPFPDDKDRNSIGELKLLANSLAHGEIIVELDGDDFLLPTCLEKIASAFEKHPEVGYVYTNNADFNEKWESRYYSEFWGWKRREFIYEGHKLWEMRDFKPCAQNFRLIYWQPDHAKAWRKSMYLAVGGHDPKWTILDDQDFCSRFYIKYGARGFHLIDECLYMYRMHGNNSCKRFNPEVQKNAKTQYLKYMVAMAEKWARDEELKLVEIGGGLYPQDNYTTVDIRNTADITCDLDGPWSLPDNSVGVLLARHVVEHLKDPIHTMNEAYRVLAPGGFFFIDVPSTDGRGAFQDPTHRSFWNPNSFRYYTQKKFASFIRPQYTGRFQELSVRTYNMEPTVPVVRADLCAAKPGYEEIAAGRIDI